MSSARNDLSGFELTGEIQDILRNIFDFFGMLDREGRVITLAGNIFSQTNTDPSLLIGQRFSETVFWQSSEDTGAILDQAIGKAAAGQKARLLLDFRISSEKNIAVDLHLFPILGDSIVDKIFLAAQQSGAEENRIGQRKEESEELRRVRDEAVEANRAKDFFLAFVSHELRSPLNAILGWSKILLTKTVDDETRRNALETIERSARFQTKLINDLVDSARVASGKLSLEFRPTSLYEVVRMTYHSLRPTAESQNIALEFTTDNNDAVVFGDAGRLQQVFGNLISNAIKFTPAGGTVSINAITMAKTAEIRVRDTGHGIGPETLPNIFQQFAQGDGSSGQNRAGLGLGLSIVNILVGKHGGTVTAESEGKGLGSTFTVTLPLSSAKAEKTTKAASRASGRISGRPLAGVSILLVEDDADSREVLELFLQQSGAEVKTATSARSAISQLQKIGEPLPDVMVSDLAMPDEDGYSLMSRIRQMSPEGVGSLPSLALSAFATKESKEKAFEAGFQKYLTKPFEPDLLIADILALARRD